MLQRTAPHGMRTFLTVLAGRVVSLTGSGLTSFALGVWVFQRTGSATQFALIAVFATLPGILIAPVAGALVDRWDRRWAMFLSESMSALGVLGIALLLRAGQLQIWHIYVANIWISAFGAFEGPAMTASISLLVPKEHLGRANGMAQAGLAIGQIISPALAGILIGLIQLPGVILVDFASYLFALVTFLLVRIPRPAISAEGAAAKGHLLREAAFGWVYIQARPGLLALLLFFAVGNFAIGMIQVLITPLVLSFASPAALGTVLSIAGFGLLLGSVVMSIWGGPKRHIYGIFGFMAVQGALLLLGGLRPNVPLVATAAFAFLFSPPIINGSSQAIWQKKIAPDLQGRVFAIRTMVAWSTLPLAYLVSGPLTDKVFEPLMAVHGPLSASLGQILGAGPGRGIGLLFMVLGVLILLLTAVGYLYPRLRFVETEIPDAIAGGEDRAANASEPGNPVVYQPLAGTGGDGGS